MGHGPGHQFLVMLYKESNDYSCISNQNVNNQSVECMCKLAFVIVTKWRNVKMFSYHGRVFLSSVL